MSFINNYQFGFFFFNKIKTFVRIKNSNKKRCCKFFFKIHTTDPQIYFNNLKKHYFESGEHGTIFIPSVKFTQVHEISPKMINSPRLSLTWV